ncbi:MAG: hypothetical protein RLY70_4710, partial [Planctomycetota bacterium]
RYHAIARCVVTTHSRETPQATLKLAFGQQGQLFLPWGDSERLAHRGTQPLTNTKTWQGTAFELEPR